MGFTNQNNRCTFIGCVSTEPEEVTYGNSKAMEFDLTVYRSTETGFEPVSDVFRVITFNERSISFLKTNVYKGKTISCRGEMRLWKDGTTKLCTDHIVIDMSSTSQHNRCKLIGYVNSINTDAPDNEGECIEMQLVVFRPTKPGTRTSSDTFTVIIKNSKALDFVKANVKKGNIIEAHGEVRIIPDGSVVIISNKITVRW